MNAKNLVSANLPEDRRQAVSEGFAMIRENLSCLIDLTPSERRQLRKVGDKERAFTKRALDLAERNLDVLPRRFDLAEMRRDIQLLESLQPILQEVRQLQELVNDTWLAANSEAYGAALAIYNYAKASDEVTGLDGTLGDLKRQFAPKTKKKKPTEGTGS
ncbi:hypothetical protein [Leptolyngbya sp. FACHB-261]|uniref:hypothetical protein n=1 Tax=Leptolyngbya sp. FACHB-261 TaxID=2692806 RepID=UPI001681E13B|nr:hypothetical protein [Leptolyngbya sp. FACHB-261]MBD2100156.1 hypothetical protein [Leptolyngbya sp. FACHB-261]